MIRKTSIALLILLTSTLCTSAQIFRGKITDHQDKPVEYVTVGIAELNRTILTDHHGVFRFGKIPAGTYTLKTSLVGYNSHEEKLIVDHSSNLFLTIKLENNGVLQEVEVFGERYKQPEKLDAITRMPLRPSEQIQSISVISEKVIAEQGALTITDVVKNVPGVTLFGSYGGVRESLSTRGYRGVPILKNGVRVDSDFRTASLASDMQGVESVQVIKGSAAITQGVGNDLGSPGGVVNVVTKTPKFVNGGKIGIRSGSWGQFRPTFDVQSILNKKETVAFRLNGAYERADGFKRLTATNKIYVNPSIEWRPDNKTTITLEMDYMDSDKTPDVGTVNLGATDTEALYEDAKNKYFGFNTDNVNNKTTTYAARITRKLSETMSLRAAYFGSSYQADQTSSGLAPLIEKDANGKNITRYEDSRRNRSLGHSTRNDKNKTLQLDLIGRDVYTGTLKHTFQVGFDYRATDLKTVTDSISYKGNTRTSLVIDQIDVFDSPSSINNTLPANVKMIAGVPSTSNSSNYGIMIQDVTTFNDYLKAIVGLRYSYGRSSDNKVPGIVTGDAWNPMAGMMITPIKNINLFASYTTTTSLRSAANKTEDGGKIGASKSTQWETGIKSDWLNNRLRFNFTYFYINNANLSNQAYDPTTNQALDFYYKAGDLRRQGIETELSGRILDNLQVMLGYAYLKAEYRKSPSYVTGSAPMNAPKHTANGWIQYVVNESFLKGLSIGVGAYYVGDRPVNDYSTKPDGHNITVPDVKPFDMPAYTTINAQLGYTYKTITARVFFNNIFDEIGYSSYFRGGYINQIDPRNFATNISYRF